MSEQAYGIVVPIRPAPLFERVQLVRTGSGASARILIALAGPVRNGRARHPWRVVASVSSRDRGALFDRTRRIAEHFGLDLIQDLAGCVNARRGPTTYSLRGVRAGGGA